MKKCCVLIPYYNAGDSLIDSINSIDHEYYTPDVIVVDDGSIKSPANAVIKNYNGPLTVKLITLEQNRGIEHALNAGLEEYGNQYELIARLDCGDICKNHRIKKQIDFLDKNKSCFLVGSWVDFVDMSGAKLFTMKHPSDHAGIKKRMFVNSAFGHPAVMFRSTVLKTVGMYPLDTPAAEDYAFFFKIIKKHETANIPESLIDYEVNPNAISTTKRKIQIKNRISIIAKNFDCSPHAIYGLIRSTILLYTPRSFTVFLNKKIHAIQGKTI